MISLEDSLLKYKDENPLIAIQIYIYMWKGQGTLQSCSLSNIYFYSILHKLEKFVYFIYLKGTETEISHLLVYFLTSHNREGWAIQEPGIRNLIHVIGLLPPKMQFNKKKNRRVDLGLELRHFHVSCALNSHKGGV